MVARTLTTLRFASAFFATTFIGSFIFFIAEVDSAAIIDTSATILAPIFGVTAVISLVAAGIAQFRIAQVEAELGEL